MALAESSRGGRTPAPRQGSLKVLQGLGIISILNLKLTQGLCSVVKRTYL